MSRNYDLHLTNYVLKYFRHLMTEVERAADDAVVLPVVLHTGHGPDKSEQQITFQEGTPEAMVREAKAALQNGGPVFRRRTRERILAEHRTEVFANACPECGRLPATPKAVICLWCSHSRGDAAKS